MNFCSIASGSSGNCIYTGSNDHHILIDAGISGKRIEQGLNTMELSGKDMDAIFITHEHVDHIKSIGVLTRKWHTPIYATEGTIAYMKRCTSLGKVDESLYHVIRRDEDVQIGDLTVHPFAISHDAAEPVGYRVTDGKKSVAVATDMGIYDSYTVQNLTGLDGLLLESNHDVRMLEVGPYPYQLKRRILGNHGHLSNEACGRLLNHILHDRLDFIFLGHLSKENNLEALAYETVCSEIILGDNPYHAKDFRIQVAKRDQPCMCVNL